MDCIASVACVLMQTTVLAPELMATCLQASVVGCIAHCDIPVAFPRWVKREIPFLEEEVKLSSQASARQNI